MKKTLAEYMSEADVDSKVDIATSGFEKTIEAKNQTPEQVVSDFEKALKDADVEMRKMKENKRAIINLQVNTKKLMFQVIPGRVQMFEDGKANTVVLSGTNSDIGKKLLNYLKNERTSKI